MVRDIIRLIRSFSQKERYLFYGASVVFSLALLAAIVNGFYSNTIVQPATGGEYTEGVIGQPVAVNPILAGTSEVDRDLVKTLFSDVISLAQNYSTSSTGKVWTVKLKQDLLWSDGEPLTSADVVFTLNMIQDPDSGSPLAQAWQGITIDRISDLEVRFTLKSPYAFFLDNLKNFYVAPAHVFDKVPAANLDLSDFNLQPVGSGPYKFVSYEKQKSGLVFAYRLERNPNFAGAPALIERLNFIFFSNYNDAFLAFNNKTIDGLGGFDPATADQLKINHKTTELSLPRYYAVFFNSSNNPVLKDASTRRALDLAIDKEKLVANILRSAGEASRGPLSPFLEGYSSSTYANAVFSQQEAGALLQKNGWKKDDKGIYGRTVGKVQQTLQFELIVPNIPFLIATANELQVDWAALGAAVTVTVETPEEVQNQRIKSRNYDALLFGNVLRNSDLYSFWHSSQTRSPGLNLALYQNSKVDALLDSVRKNFSESKRSADLKKIQELIYSDTPAVFLYSPYYLYGSPKNLGGFDTTFLLTPSDRFNHIGTWFLQTSRIFK